MKYVEHRPGPSLADRIECFWFAEDSAAGMGQAEPERILPDGCIEWIFHLGRPYADGQGRLQPSSFVVGPTTAPLSIAPTGAVATLGVRFRPGGARGLLPPLERLAGAFPTSEEAFDAGGRRVAEEVGNARGFASRQAVLETFLQKRLGRTRSRDPRVSAAIGLILSFRGRASISGIARRLGCSPRQLEREFGAGVGLTPKALSRIVRFQNLLRLAGRRPDASWADLAARCGYADQAHLVREFKAFSGATPTSREETHGALARYFIDPSRIDALLSPIAPVAFLQDGASASA
jgi:AraC-like DNA-binding protein